MIKGRFYCPYCDLEMAGSGHLDEGEAWGMYECEYNSKASDLKPISEIDRNKGIIKRLTKQKNEINKNIRAIKRRNDELIKLEK